jgi:asparagine synthase (glutamine-hydrolysing)
MSAIAGLFYRNGKCVEDTELHRMREALQAHGLNGGGAWCKESIGLLQQQIGFTPEDFWERQPAFSPDRQVVAVSAARLDNRPELARELGLPFPGPDPWPDSEFLLQAYLRWGADCPRHLIGDYTFALWNAREQSLLLAVSPFSGRPLHYHISKDFFAFATMPKGLFALERVPRELDEDYLAKYLARVPRAPESTFYQGICRVLPGYTVLIDRDRQINQPFWELDSEHELRFSSDEEYVEAFLDLYERVVHDHLRSAMPVGIMLSGGLDSSSIAAMAAPLLKTKNQRLAAFTEVPRAGFEMPSEKSRYSDETSLVQAIAALYDNIDLNFIHTNDSHFLQDSDRLFQHTDAPFRNACNRPWFEAILHEAQQQGIRVLLMGSQGNLTFSWKGREKLPQLVRQQRWNAAMREARAIANNTPGGAAWKNLVIQGITPNLPSAVQSVISRVREILTQVPAQRFISPLHPEYAREHAIDVKGKNLNSFLSLADSGSPTFRYDTIHKTTTAGNTLMAGYQAMFGVEIRDPTADERIVRFCLALPEDQFRRNGISRRLARQTMAGLLPKEILSSQRRGLQSADWHEKLAQSHLDLQSELDKMAVCSLVDRLIDLPSLRDTLKQVFLQQRTMASMDIGTRNYLEHGLMTGSFIHWFQTRR